VPGILLASQLTVRVPDRSLRVGLATVLLLSGVKLLDLPGSSYLIPVVLGAGIVLVAYGELRRGQRRQAALARR
jgi:hypothetical protein